MKTLFADVILNSSSHLSNEGLHRFVWVSRYRIQKAMRNGDGEIRRLKLAIAPELTHDAFLDDLGSLLMCVRNDVEEHMFARRI